jgi:hypothetical protein
VQFACQPAASWLARASDNAYILGNPAAKVKEWWRAAPADLRQARQTPEIVPK